MTKQNITECTKARLGYGLTQSEVAKRLGISIPVYSLSEQRKRNVSVERMEKLYYDIHHAGVSIVKEKEKMANDINLNTYAGKNNGEFNNDEEIQDELDFELHYEQLTEKMYQTVLMKYVFKGKTVVRAAADLGLCEDELRRRLDKDGHEYIMGDSWESLVR